MAIILGAHFIGSQRRLRTLPGDESSPIGDIVCAFRLLLDKCDINSPGSDTYASTVRSKLRSIFGSEAVGEVFTYFCLFGASTAWVIQCQLEMSEATVYRALKRLRAMGIVVPALKVSKVRRSKGGPRPTVWALEGASPEEVTRAYNEMRKSRRETGE